MIPASEFLSLSPDEVTPEVEREFFSSLRMRNGTYKTTFQNRFTEINRTLLQLLNKRAVSVVNVMDIGISSGSATLELYEDLNAAGFIATKIAATDLMIDGYLVRVLPRCFALVDDTGYPLRYDIYGRSIKPWVIHSDYRSGFFLVRKLINVLLGYRAQRKMRRPGHAHVQRVRLVTPRIGKYPELVVQKDDITIFNPAFEGKFNFIRAANILNLNYFAEAQLRLAVANVMRYLSKPTGLFLVVRTHQDESNHGTLFAVDHRAGCSILERYGQGSEIEDVVLQSVASE